MQRLNKITAVKIVKIPSGNGNVRGQTFKFETIYLFILLDIG